MKWPVTQNSVARISANLALTMIVMAFIAPMLWMFSASLNPTATLAFDVPDNPGLDNFRQLGSWDQVIRPLLNSLFLAVVASSITVAVACLCAYPLSRYKLRFGTLFLYLILLSSGLPVIALMIPTYRGFSEFGFIDSVPMVTLYLAATSLPFAIWLAKNFIDGVPMALEEAARMDGATTWQVITRVLVPLIRPGMIVLFIFCFVGNWGNFFVPFVLLLSPEYQTASQSIYNYFNNFGGVYYGRVAAFAIVYSAPAVLMYALISRTVGRSLSFAGAVKE